MRCVKALLTGYLVCTAHGAIAQTVPPETITDYPSSGVQLGNGWDSRSSQKTTAVCVVAASATDPGQHKYITYTDVTDSSSMMKALSVSAEAKIASITGAGASASLKFSRETTLTTSGANVVVNAIILEGATYAVAPQGKLPAQQALNQRATPSVTNARPNLAFLNQGAILLTTKAASLAKRNPTAFRQQCGDYFVSMIRNASGLEGVVSANTRNEAEKTSASADIRGTYGAVSANVAATQRMESMASQGRISIQYHQIGGAGTAISTTPEAFRKLIVEIGPIAADTRTPAPHHIGLMSYKRLANYRSPFATNPDMEVMANQYYRLETIRRQLFDAISHPQNYVFNEKVAQDGMNSLATEVQNDMNKLTAALGKCVNQPKSCHYPAGIERTDYTYRSKMPLIQVAAADWIELKAAEAALPAAIAARDQTPASISYQHCVTWAFGVCTNRSERFRPNPQHQQAQATVDQLNATVARLAGAKSVDEQRYRLFILLPAQQRCQSGENDVCINATEMAKFKTVMWQ